MVSALFETAPELLHNAGMELLHPLPLLASRPRACCWAWGSGSPSRGNLEMAGAVLVGHVRDGLFLVAALIHPGMSGLIE